ncbi:maltase 1-like [Planococcus citri]|uniref:maltase 1-like n=1 Tax=Planococcus citri TaxID=170843 RepID=UPI0031F953BE
MKYYGTKSFPVFHLPFNFLLTTLTTYLDAKELHDFLHTWLDAVPKGMPSNWALGNHDYGRIVRNLDTEYNFILLALVSMLPGTATLYYGEELSLGANHLVPIKDPYDRFFHRSPMQWDDTRDAGFTSGEKPWLPVHPNYWRVNVQTQKAQENSTLNYFKDLMSLRKTDIAKYGTLKFYIVSKWVLGICRTYKGASYITIMNLGTETQPLDLHADMNNLSEYLTVVASSPNSGYKKGFKLKTMPNYPLTSVLRPHSVIILSTK